MDIQVAAIGAFAALLGVLVGAVIDFIRTRVSVYEARRTEYQNFLISLFQQLLLAKGEYASSKINPWLFEEHKESAEIRLELLKLRVTYGSQGGKALAQAVAVCLAARDERLIKIANDLLHSKEDKGETIDRAVERFGEIIANLSR